MSSNDNLAHDRQQVLQVFCSRGPEAYRVHVHPGWVPRAVHQCLDKDGEGMAQLDFEQLERNMQRAGLTYETSKTTTGSVELTASGDAAVVLGSWLAGMFASGVR